MVVATKASMYLGLPRNIMDQLVRLERSYGGFKNFRLLPKCRKCSRQVASPDKFMEQAIEHHGEILEILRHLSRGEVNNWILCFNPDRNRTLTISFLCPKCRMGKQ